MTENQTKWIEALRSGNYKQGKGKLRDGDKFCCLGVLCDIVEPSIWKNKRGKPLATGKYVAIGDEEIYVFGNPNANISCQYPPISVLNRVGISSEDAIYLSELNDKDKATFEEIAVHIEQEIFKSKRIPNSVTQK